MRRVVLFYLNKLGEVVAKCATTIEHARDLFLLIPIYLKGLTTKNHLGFAWVELLDFYGHREHCFLTSLN